MNNENNLKISNIFNLPNLNFKTQMNIAIDSNAHIKHIINVQAYLYDIMIDTVSGKCNIKGKIGVKIIYLDVDNVYNTINDDTSFSESITSSDLTSNCNVYLYNDQVTSNVEFDEKYLKVVANVNAKLFCDIDTVVNIPETEQEGFVIKRQPLESNCCVESICNQTSEESVIQFSNIINKILCTNITPTIQSIECNDGYLTISGNSAIQTIYELDNGTSNEIKIQNDNCPFRFETQATLSTSNCVADINLKIDNSKTTFSTELNDNQSKITINYEMKIIGCIFKPITINYLQDLYSTKNEIETSYSSREFCKISPLMNYKTNIDGEIQLSDDINCDEILETINHSCMITQTYKEENKIVLEGVISSTLIYFNEEREINSMMIELPFSIAKDYELSENCEPLNFELLPVYCKAKIKRGNTLSLDYDVYVQGYILEKQKIDMLDNIKCGKQIEYEDIAFQIIVTKPSEDIWNFCKRTHTTQEQLLISNKEIPPVFQGGEKIVIYR